MFVCATADLAPRTERVAFGFGWNSDRRNRQRFVRPHRRSFCPNSQPDTTYLPVVEMEHLVSALSPKTRQSAQIATGESLCDYFRVVRSKVSTNLIPTDFYDRLLDCADALPGSFGHRRYGFECSLTGPPIADLSVQLEPADPWVEDLFRWPHPDGDLGTAWRQWTTFVENWEPGLIDMMFAEFDASGVRPRTPSLFWRVARSTTLEEQMSVLKDLADNAQGERAGALLADLPPDDVRLRMVGAMLARPHTPIRLALASTRSFLENAVTDFSPIGLGLPDYVKALLPCFERVMLNLDVSDSHVLPRVGLELMPPLHASDWRSILEELWHRGMADRSRIEAALSYRGGSSPLAEPEVCPEGILKRWAQGKFEETPYLLRDINHLKIVLTPDNKSSAKIYLGVEPVWAYGPLDPARKEFIR